MTGRRYQPKWPPVSAACILIVVPLLLFAAASPVFAGAAEIAERAGKFRAAGIIDPRRLGRYFRADGGNIDLSLPGIAGREFRALWSYFFAHCQVFVGLARSEAPIVGFYNPLVDYWLFTQWSAVGDSAGNKPQVLATWILPGNLLIAPDAGTEGSLKPEPPWIRAAKSVPLTTSLTLFATESAEAFLETYPVDSATPAAPVRVEYTDDDLRRLLRDRLATMVATVITLTASNDLGPLHDTVLRSLKNQDIETLRGLARGYDLPVAPGAVTAMKPEFRTGLLPAALLDLGRDKIVISGREDNGTWYLVTHYGDLGGHAYVKAITYVNALKIEDVNRLPEPAK